MDFETISRMVRASGVSEGELILVHFWGEDADKEIANRFVAAVAAAAVAVATPCWPAPVSAISFFLPMYLARRPSPMQWLSLWAPVWLRSSRLR